MPWPRLLALALWLFATPAPAQEPQFDGVATPGLLSDADLYRLATCGATPGGDCRTAALRWGHPTLTLTVAARDKLDGTASPPGLDARLTTAVAHAIAEINAVGAGIRVILIPEGPADITIQPTTLAEGAVLTDMPGVSGAGIMGIGFTSVWSDETGTITKAVILISTGITEADLTSVMLEEVTQSLGLLFDVEGPAYEGVSILSQTSNATTTITGQDATLLRLHYPPT